MKRKTGLRRILLFGIAVVATLVVFAPAIYKIGYGFTHPGTFTVVGVSFAVPSGWVGAPKLWEADFPESKTILRLSNTLLTKVTIASIDIYQYNAREVRQDDVLERWKEEGPARFEAQGYRIMAVRELTGPGKIVCIEMNRQVEMLEVKCVFDIKRLMADYYGEDSEIQDFYSFITAAQNSNVERR